MAIQRPDTPLAATPEPVYDRVQSVMTSKENQNNGNRSASYKSNVAVKNSDGSSSAQVTKQTEKENEKSKFKQYNVYKDKEGNAKMQIDVKTNKGTDRTRMITNSDKVERKLQRVLKRNEE